jgi:hypothetical protein
MINLFEKYTTPLVCLASFFVGVYACTAWHSLGEAKQLRDIQEQVIKQSSINRKVVSDLQDVNAKSVVEYNKLKDKLNATKVTNVPCKLTTPAIELWNQSKGVESKLPTDTSGVVEGTSTPDTIAEGVGIKLVLDNALANDKICNDMRSQINGIIKWNSDTFGK